LRSSGRCQCLDCRADRSRSGHRDG
jgi:hypothetical protein